MMPNIDPVLARFIADPTVVHRNAVIESYHYLCARAARKFSRPTSDRSDLEQVAAIGLIKACHYYNIALETPFEAYAWMMVIGELMHYVRDHEQIVRLPRWLRSLEKRYLHAIECLTHRFGREPLAAEIAETMNVELSIVQEIEHLRRGKQIVSMDCDPYAPHLQSDRRHESNRPILALDERLALLSAIEGMNVKRPSSWASSPWGIRNPKWVARLAFRKVRSQNCLQKLSRKWHATWTR